MSRYVAIPLKLRSLDEVALALATMQLGFERPGARVVLEGSLECRGDPVDIRLRAGTLDSVEDFGFVTTPHGTIELVCGELDEEPLRRALVAPMHAAVVQARVEAKGLSVARIDVDPDGTHRVVVHDDTESG